MVVTAVHVKVVTEKNALFKVDFHRRGLDSGSRGELVHPISQPCWQALMPSPSAASTDATLFRNGRETKK